MAGRLEKITDKDGNEINYKYDKSGNVDNYSYDISGVSRGVSYRYDDITGEYEYTLYNVSGTTIRKDFNYDTDSLKRLISIDLIIGTNTFKKMFGYDDAKVDSSMGNATNRIYQITYQKNGTTLQYHQYTYDENHNITKIVVKVGGTTNEKNDYYYDGFNQLIREDIYLIGRVSKTMTYSYDSQSNITSIKTYALNVTTGTPQNEKRMFYQNAWKDQLTKIEYYVSGSLSYYQTFVYDASGNVTHLNDSRTSYANKSYQWDGRQLSYYSAYCNSLSFKYNDQGIRTQKAQSACSGDVTTNYTLDGDKVLVESRSNGITLFFTYDVDGTLLSMNYNGNEYFYITNLQGDIIELVDINGYSVVKYNYDAWGNIIYKSGGALADINPYLYRGYRYDIETGLYYLQSGYYDPAIGRSIKSKEVSEIVASSLSGANLYAYSINNPITVNAKTEWVAQVHGISTAGSLVSSGMLTNVNANSKWTNDFWYSSGKWNNWTGCIYYGRNEFLHIYAGLIETDMSLKNLRFNINLSLVKGEIEFNNNSNADVYLGKASININFDIYNNEFGGNIMVSAFTLERNWGPVTIEVYAGAIGAVAEYNNGRFKIGAAKIIGGSVEFDVKWLLGLYRNDLHQWNN